MMISLPNTEHTYVTIIYKDLSCNKQITVFYPQSDSPHLQNIIDHLNSYLDTPLDQKSVSYYININQRWERVSRELFARDSDRTYLIVSGPASDRFKWGLIFKQKKACQYLLFDKEIQALVNFKLMRKKRPAKIREIIVGVIDKTSAELVRFKDIWVNEMVANNEMQEIIDARHVKCLLHKK